MLRPLFTASAAPCFWSLSPCPSFQHRGRLHCPSLSHFMRAHHTKLQYHRYDPTTPSQSLAKNILFLSLPEISSSPFSFLACAGECKYPQIYVLPIRISTSSGTVAPGGFADTPSLHRMRVLRRKFCVALRSTRARDSPSTNS